MPPKPLKFASRYKRGDDDQGDNDEILMSMAEQGDPALCMVFRLPDEDEVPEDDIEKLKIDREKIIQRLRMLGFNIEQMANQKKDLIFLKITLPKELLVRQAMERKIKVRLDKGTPGAPVLYDPELERLKVLKEPDDGRNVFSSLQQLEMADYLLRSEPFRDGSDDVEQLVPEKMMTEMVKDVDPGVPRIEGYYYLHEPLLGFRGRLLREWPGAWYKPQPLHLVRSYFGEKIALYYAWLGYYISMLWLPAVLGIVFSIGQDVENPYKLIFCMALVIWITIFACLWKRLEVRLQYEYDTQDFEESEELRLEYMMHKSTVEGHRNEITGQIDNFWMDEGSYFPPKGRRARVLISYSYVVGFCALAVVLDVLVYAVISLPMMRPGDVWVGSCVCGVIFAMVTLGLELAFDQYFEYLVGEENWPTETKHEDALITRSCAFRIVSKFFGPFFVAVMANNVSVSGIDTSCPDRQCLPVVRFVIATQFSTLMLVHEIREHLVPSIRAAINARLSSESTKKKIKGKVFTFPMEDELIFQDMEGVRQSYEVFVYQLGWVGLFASVFPIMPAIALACNLLELRSDAVALLTQTKRPRYMCATDIGAWQGVINAIATLSILTNSLLVGLTSHTLYFYLPNLTEVERLWCVAILEHALFLLKLVVESFLPPDTQEDREAFEKLKFNADASVAAFLKPGDGED